MPITIEMTDRRAARLQAICRQICKTYKRYPNEPLGRSVIHDLSKGDIEIIADVIHAITDNQIGQYCESNLNRIGKIKFK